MLRIARDFPGVRFLHIIRDGRDVALSLDKRGWSRPLPWHRDKSLLAAGLYWEWIVRKARSNGAKLGGAYMEVRYEQLVADPRSALARVADFIGQHLDYKLIQQNAIGSVQRPLTAFEEDLQRGDFHPVGRWQQRFPAGQLAFFEKLVGDYLQELGYALSDGAAPTNLNFVARQMRIEYRWFYNCKQWAKIHTPLSRMMVNYSEILIDK
jgi:hypothetical protein